jgi:hypothetical protein
MQWSKIVENAISTIVALIVVSAGAILWREAMSVDNKIDAATEGLIVQANAMSNAIAIIEDTFADLQQEVSKIKNTKQTYYIPPVRSAPKAVSSAKKTTTATSVNSIDTIEPFTPPEPIEPIESQRIQRGYIQQQLPDYNFKK